MNDRQMELETMPELIALRQRTWKGMVAMKMDADVPGQVRVSSDLWEGISQALAADPAGLRVFGLPVRLDTDLPVDTVTVDSGGRIV